MAIYRTGPLGGALSGALGGIVFAASVRGAVVRPRPAPRHSAATKRLEANQQYKTAVSAWTSLTDNQRDAWRAAARVLPYVTRLGETRPPSGFQIFVQANLISLRWTNTTTPDPLYEELTARAGDASLTAYLNGPYTFQLSGNAGSGPNLAQVFASRSFRTITPKFPKRFRQVRLDSDIDPATYTVDLFPAFSTTFGPLQIGESITAKARILAPTEHMLPTQFTQASTLTIPAFQADAQAFDGVSDYALRGADLTGNADTKLWTEVGFFSVAGGSATTRTLRDNTNNRWRINLDSTNRLVFQGRDTANTNIIVIRTTTTFPADATWHSFAFSVDTATDTVILYIDAALEAFTTVTLTTNATMDTTRVNHSFGGTVNGTQLFPGCLSSWWASLTEALDFHDPTVLDVFIDSNGEPRQLGPNGQLPTGQVPIIYIENGRPAQNTGAGGNFLDQAAADQCATTP